MLIASLPLLFMANMLLGSVDIPVTSVLDILLGKGDEPATWSNIILRTRMPQTMTAMACGAGLSVAGLLMQTAFRNPLAGPSVLGVASAASLGVAMVVLLGGAFGGAALTRMGLVGNTAMIVAATAGAIAAMGLILAFAQRVRTGATLLIIGVMTGYIATAIVGILKYFSTEEEIRTYVIWGLGSFSRVTGGQVNLFVGLTAAVLPLSMLLSKPLNMLMLGEQYATNLGLNVRRAMTATLAEAGVLTAIVTAYCGPIMFIGLAVPHISRGLMRTSDHRVTIPATMICGASLAMACNLIARLPGFDGTLPINSVTALIGAPVAVYILLKRAK